MSNFKTFGQALTFPLDINADWVRIQCGVDGKPNWIFGIEGVKDFYNTGAGIYSRDNYGKPKDSLQHWITWYNAEKEERIKIYSCIQEIKQLLSSNKIKGISKTIGLNEI